MSVSTKGMGSSPLAVRLELTRHSIVGVGPPPPEQKSTTESLEYGAGGVERSSRVRTRSEAAMSAGETFWRMGRRWVHSALSKDWPRCLRNEGTLWWKLALVLV